MSHSDLSAGGMEGRCAKPNGPGFIQLQTFPERSPTALRLAAQCLPGVGGGGTVTPKTWSWEALGDRKLQISPSQTEGRVVRTDSQTEGSLGRIFPTASLIQPPNCSWTVSQDTLQNWLMYPWGPPGPS